MPEPVIDQVTYNNLVEMVGADFIDELIAAYLEEAPKLMAEMVEALAQGDSESLGRAAHSFKSNSASFGATSLSTLARELEFMGKDNSLDGAAQKLEQLGVEYEQVERALMELRDGS